MHGDTAVEFWLASTHPMVSVNSCLWILLW